MSNLETRYVLTGFNGPVQGREFVILSDEVRLGRTPENDIILDETNISRHHASLWVEKGQLRVRDMESKNGIFVNDKKVSATTLYHGDVLRIGQSLFRVGQDETNPYLPEFNRLFDYLTTAKELLGKIGPRRLAMYSVAAFVLLYGISVSRKSDPNKLESAPVQASENVLPSVISSGEAMNALITPSNASNAEILAWQSRADLALKYDDAAAALPLLRKIVAAKPDDPRASAQLVRASNHVAFLIQKYDQSAAREFEKLYYENALTQWRKVLSLSQDFDAETYHRTEDRIREVEQKLAQKP